MKRIHKNQQRCTTNQDYVALPNATNSVIRIMPNGSIGAIDVIATDGNTNLPMVLQGGGSNVGLGMTPTTNKLEVNGTASKSTAGDWLANSDQRLKKNINTIPSGYALQKLLQLRGVTYEWNDDKTGYIRPTGVQIGFIAQEIQKVFPEKVIEDAQGYLQTAYGDYDPLYIQAFKELIDEINLLKSENESLKSENKEINQKMDALVDLENRILSLEKKEK